MGQILREIAPGDRKAVPSYLNELPEGPEKGRWLAEFQNLSAENARWGSAPRTAEARGRERATYLRSTSARLCEGSLSARVDPDLFERPIVTMNFQADPSALK